MSTMRILAMALSLCLPRTLLAQPPAAPSPYDTALFKAIRSGDAMALRQRLDAGANPNVQLKLFPPYRAVGPDRGADLMLTMGATPLLRAAKAADVAAIRLLLAHGADPNLPNIQGVTPVMAAAGLGSNEIDTRGRFKTQPDQIASIDLLVKAALALGILRK